MAFLPQMNTGTSFPIFNVEIVGPVEEDVITEPMEVSVSPGSSVTKKSWEMEPPPETIFGEATEIKPADSGKEKTSHSLFFNRK